MAGMICFRRMWMAFVERLKLCGREIKRWLPPIRGMSKSFTQWLKTWGRPMRNWPWPRSENILFNLIFNVNLEFSIVLFSFCQLRTENIRKERDILKQVENRLNQEKESILTEQRSQNLLFTNLKSIQVQSHPSWLSFFGWIQRKEILKNSYYEWLTMSINDFFFPIFFKTSCFVFKTRKITFNNFFFHVTAHYGALWDWDQAALQ